MFHTSPKQILPGMINTDGVAGDCLFFSTGVYVMGAFGKTFHTYEADFECVPAGELCDEEIVAEIAGRLGVNAEMAERLLDGRESDRFLDAEDSWWLQGRRGACAKKMGYDGCKDEDEQGTVYIVPMKGCEGELIYRGENWDE